MRSLLTFARMLNVPPEIGMHLHQTLMQEIEQAADHDKVLLRLLLFLGGCLIHAPIRSLTASKALFCCLDFTRRSRRRVPKRRKPSAQKALVYISARRSRCMQRLQRFPSRSPLCITTEPRGGPLQVQIIVLRFFFSFFLLFPELRMQALCGRLLRF